MTLFDKILRYRALAFVATCLLIVTILGPGLAFAQAAPTPEASLGTQVTFALISAAVALFGVLAVFGARWLNANVKNDMLKGVLLRLDDVVYTVVKEINQTVLDASRDPVTGKLLPDAAEKAKAAALAKVKAYLGADGLKLLLKIIGFGGDPDTFLLSKIEAAVHDVKALKPAVSAAVPSGASTSGQPGTP